MSDAGVDAGDIRADVCVELPHRAPPSEVQVEFVTQITSADVYFLVDVTGSMGEEIDQIRRLLSDEIVPELAADIPDILFSVGHFADFALPLHNYGEMDDDLYRLVQSSTDSIEAIQAAVNELPLQGGRDGPEALVEAMYLSATGEGFGTFAEPAACPARTVGYPCFRENGSRIFLVFTDAPSHNGPGGRDAYRAGTVEPQPHTYEESVEALNGIGAKVLGLYSGTAGGAGVEDLEAYARATGAVRTDGSPIVFDVGRDGAGLSAAVVEAVRTLVEEVPLDVAALVEDVPGDAFDARSFVDQIIALSADPAEGATIAGDRFDNVMPGTRVRFSIQLHNELIPQTNTPQVFYMRVVLEGDGITRLQETTVQVVVPSLLGEGCDAP